MNDMEHQELNWEWEEKYRKYSQLVRVFRANKSSFSPEIVELWETTLRDLVISNDMEHQELTWKWEEKHRKYSQLVRDFRANKSSFSPEIVELWETTLRDLRDEVEEMRDLLDEYMEEL